MELLQKVQRNTIGMKPELSELDCGEGREALDLSTL